MAAFFLVQNFASLACLAIVGRLGDAALAGLGIGGVLCGAATALLYGFDTAVQALVSRATGAGREAGAAEELYRRFAPRIFGLGKVML
ncbi:MAG: MATE family efflux transporter, partial [Caulobacteraceae bacterium]